MRLMVFYMSVFFFFKQKTAYEVTRRLEFRRVLFRSARPGARRAHHVGRRRLDRRPARGGGAERAPRRRARTRARRGPGRGRDRGGGRVHEALRIRRRGKTGERHPWTNPTGGGGMTDADESLNKAEDLLARLEQARARLDETQDPDKAIEILQELADLAREVEAELQRAKRAAETEAAAPPAPEASDG